MAEHVEQARASLRQVHAVLDYKRMTGDAVPAVSVTGALWELEQVLKQLGRRR